MLGLPLAACSRHSYHYHGDALTAPRPWLKNKRIFVDGGYDPAFVRTIPEFLRADGDGVARLTGILAELLDGAGVTVETSRGSSGALDVAEKARRFAPDLIIGIRAQAPPSGTSHPSRPLIMLAGPGELHAPSLDFAVILMDEFHRIMDGEGIIAPASLMPGDEGAFLGYTSSLCPGVTAFPASYPGMDHSRLAGQIPYLEKLAEACLNAASTYFQRGVPTARVSFSCPIETAETGVPLVRDAHPTILIHADGGGGSPGVDGDSLRVYLNGLSLPHVKISDSQYRVDYGNRLHPGRHQLRFMFKNLRGQSSMTHTVTFILESRPGDRERLIREGTRLAGTHRHRREGLAMLLAALSHGIARDGIEDLYGRIIRGCTALRDAEGAGHFRNELALIREVDRDVHARKPLPSRGAGIRFHNAGLREAVVFSGQCPAEKDSPAGRSQGLLDCIRNNAPGNDFWGKRN